MHLCFGQLVLWLQEISETNALGLSSHKGTEEYKCISLFARVQVICIWPTLCRQFLKSAQFINRQKLTVKDFKLPVGTVVTTLRPADHLEQ